MPGLFFANQGGTQIARPDDHRKIAMTRSSSVFRQADVARALKAVQAAKVPISGVEITADGTIRVLITPERDAPASPFDAWKNKH
jgi:hypothetical protein